MPRFMTGHHRGRTQVCRQPADELRWRASGYEAAGSVLRHLQSGGDGGPEHGVSAALGARAHADTCTAARIPQLCQQLEGIVLPVDFEILQELHERLGLCLCLQCTQ